MDRVIPVINCPYGDTACITEKLDALRMFSKRIHLDIADGTFTPVASGIDAETWKRVGKEFELEVHLMVAAPESIVAAWLEAGAKRVIVHVETLSGEAGKDRFNKIKMHCDMHHASIVCAARAETPLEELTHYAPYTNEFCVLAVNPGPPGQLLHPAALGLIQELRAAFPHTNIEVDGGITPETTRQLREAGATSVCAGTYIFSHANPSAAFAELQNALQ